MYGGWVMIIVSWVSSGIDVCVLETVVFCGVRVCVLQFRLLWGEWGRGGVISKSET